MFVVEGLVEILGRGIESCQCVWQSLRGPRSGEDFGVFLLSIGCNVIVFFSRIINAGHAHKSADAEQTTFFRSRCAAEKKKNAG
jgi:hypothetical protein